MAIKKKDYYRTSRNMISKHDKLFVSVASYSDNCDIDLKNRLEKARKKVSDSMELRLREDDTFKGMPFLWVRTDENYGDFPSVEIKVEKINRVYGDAGVKINVPISDVKNLKHKSDSEIERYFQTRCFLSLGAVLEEYG